MANPLTNSLTSNIPVVIPCHELYNSPVEVVKYSLEWSLKVDFKDQDRASPIRSHEFSFGKDKKLKACIVLYPSGVPQAKNKGMASLYLESDSIYKSSITGKLEFSFNMEGFLQPASQEMALTQDTFTPGLGWGFENMCGNKETFWYWNPNPDSSKALICKWRVGCLIFIAEDKLSACAADKANLVGTQGQVPELEKVDISMQETPSTSAVGSGAATTVPEEGKKRKSSAATSCGAKEPKKK